MAGTIIDMSTIKQMLQLSQDGVSNRQIARQLGISRDKVNEFVNAAHKDSLGINGLLKLEDPILERRFHSGNPAYTDDRMSTFLGLLPDFVEQLGHKHVTRLMVWEDYRKIYPDGYGKSQFFFHLAQHLKAQKQSTSVLRHEAGNELYVDFAGDTLGYVDINTGECIPMQVFVATLACTDYAFAFCVPSQKTEDFLYALVRCLEFYGGVPKIVVPDNLKAAVVKADKYEPTINKAMEDMGNHYGFVVLPCQPYSPTHKGLVENQVKIIYHRIYAKLHNRQFFSAVELNASVAEFLKAHNRTRMQQRPYSREEHFHAVEKEALKPLPDTPYTMKRYADVTVQQNGHVYLSCDKHYYSVPYTLIGCKARIIFTTSLVKIYVKGEQVAVHSRERNFGYTSNDDHLASNTIAFTKRSADYYKRRAQGVSGPLFQLFNLLFERSNGSLPPEYYYKTCDMMLRLQRDNQSQFFDQACEICIENHLFTGKRLENVIKTLAKCSHEPSFTSTPTPKDHANMRGNLFFQ
ncbi:MAG TPA: IS21 family transposase [Bacteroidales bacterium]|nr:IS21 family transposase [Bacteroidales bacterium]